MSTARSDRVWEVRNTWLWRRMCGCVQTATQSTTGDRALRSVAAAQLGPRNVGAAGTQSLSRARAVPGYSDPRGDTIPSNDHPRSCRKPQ